MNDTIAIDFGTIRTKLSYVDPQSNSVELMRLGRDERLFEPSVFLLRKDGPHMFGDDAADYLDSEPLGFLSRPLKRELREQFVRAGNRIKATPSELLSLLFCGLRDRTKEIPHFKDTLPVGLTLTIPAQYGPPDKEILAKAARDAGFAEERINFVDEPIAAAQAWLSKIGGQEEYVIVLDCGGGTLDWACLHRLDNNAFEMIPELPPGGDNRVGGFDIDEALFALIDDEIADEETRKELQTRRCFIRDQIRAIKEKYSRTEAGGEIRVGNISIVLSPEKIDTIICRRFVSQACQNLNSYLEKVRIKIKVDKPTVLLVGGSARLRGFKEAIAEQCKCNPVWWERSEYATVLGALLPSVTQTSNSKHEISAAEHSAKDVSLQKSVPELSDVNKSLAQAQYNEAVTALHAGNADIAINKLNMCIMLSPSMYKARELIVQAYTDKKDLQSAMLAAKVWTDMDSDNTRAWSSLGFVAFACGDFVTAEMCFSRNIASLDTEGLLLLAASLYRQGKIDETGGVLSRIETGEVVRTVRIFKFFILAWLKRGSDYSEEDLRSYAEALAGWRSLTAEESANVISTLNMFGISMLNFILSVQIEMLCALLTLKHGDLRESMSELYEKCAGNIDTKIVWATCDPDRVGRILASTLCLKGKLKEATDLVVMCARNPTFDIRLIQQEEAFKNHIDNQLVWTLFQPVFSVTENHGVFLNDLTVLNCSPYSVTNVSVKVQVIRWGGKADVPFTVSFGDIAAGTTQRQNGVFKNAGLFGGDVEKVDILSTTCDQECHRAKALATNERKWLSSTSGGRAASKGYPVLVDSRELFCLTRIVADIACDIVCPQCGQPAKHFRLEGVVVHKCVACGWQDYASAPSATGYSHGNPKL